jgi:hypothetical protein
MHLLLFGVELNNVVKDLVVDGVEEDFAELRVLLDLLVGSILFEELTGCVWVGVLEEKDR